MLVVCRGIGDVGFGGFASLELGDDALGGGGPDGLYEWEPIYRQGPWSGIEDVEWATGECVDWFTISASATRSPPSSGYTTATASEADYYRQTVPTIRGPGLKPPSLYETRVVHTRVVLVCMANHSGVDISSRLGVGLEYAKGIGRQP